MFPKRLVFGNFSHSSFKLCEEVNSYNPKNIVRALFATLKPSGILVLVAGTTWNMQKHWVSQKNWYQHFQKDKDLEFFSKTANLGGITKSRALACLLQDFFCFSKGRVSQFFSLCTFSKKKLNYVKGSLTKCFISTFSEFFLLCLVLVRLGSSLVRSKYVTCVKCRLVKISDNYWTLPSQKFKYEQSWAFSL